MGHNQDVISWVNKARTEKTISIKIYVNFVTTRSQVFQGGANIVKETIWPSNILKMLCIVKAA